MIKEDQLIKLVKENMFINLQAGYSHYLKTHYIYNKPSFERYPFQWWWDTCFHVFILCALGEYELAKQNMISLFKMQEEDGFVGHMIYWQRMLPKNIFNIIEAKPTLRNMRPHMSALIQPSFVAQAVEHIYKQTEDRDFLELMLPKLIKYHEWVIRNRDFDGDGLVTIIAPVESGIDWKPSYDEVLNFHDGVANWKLYFKMLYCQVRNFIDRYDLERIKKANRFRVKDTGLNTINALDLYALSRLCDITNNYESSKRYTAHAKKMTKSIIDIMYDAEDEAFYDVYGPDNKKLKVKTPTILFPTILPDTPHSLATNVIKKHLQSEQEFYLPYPVPSVARSEKSFVPGRHHFLGQEFIWRGPTWVFYNWFIFKCLKKEGLTEKAKHLRDTVMALIEKSGFREYYNPFSGEGYGAERFTWSGLVLDMAL